MRKRKKIKVSLMQAPMHFAPTAIEHEIPQMSRSEKAGVTAILFVLIMAVGFFIAAVQGFAELRGF